MKKISFISIFLILISYNLPAQLSINTENFITNNLPYFSVEVIVFDDGDPREISRENLLILESDYSYEIDRLEDLGGFRYRAHWVSKFANYDSIYSVRVLATLDGKSVSSIEIGFLDEWPEFNMFSVNDEKIYNIEYGAYLPNQEIISQIFIGGYIAKADTSEPFENMILDSIVIDSPNFYYEWRGARNNPSYPGPPNAILRRFQDYLINVTFYPTTFDYYHEDMVIYFNGGNKLIVPLTGNKYEVDIGSSLNIIQPNGGEILTPCQTYEILWEGNTLDLPVEIYYSNNDGINWSKIADVVGRSYIWNVPADITDKAKIRIIQPFNTTSQIDMQDQNDRVDKIDFNLRGTKVIACYNDGLITEWDLLQQVGPQVMQRYNIDQSGNRSLSIKDIKYLNDEDAFAVVYSESFIPADSDSIAFFRNGETNPFKRLKFPNRFRVQKTELSQDNDELYITPFFGSKILVYDLINYEYEKDFSFEYPISDLSISGEENEIALLTMMNGITRTLDPSNFNLIKEIDFSEYEIFAQNTISNNNQLIGATSISTNDLEQNASYIFDYESGDMIKLIRENYGNSLSSVFNSVTSMFVLGYPFIPQVSIYDLTSTQQELNIDVHPSQMRDMVISPQGVSIAAAVNSAPFLKLLSFSYPEEDESESTFQIIEPQISTNFIKIEETFVDNQVERYTAEICNTGEVFLDIEALWFGEGIHFELKAPFERDSLFPGECLELEIIYHPKDTGLIRDVLYFRHCNEDFEINIESNSLPRNLPKLTNSIDFGEVCIGDTSIIRVDFFRNDDPVNLNLGSLSFIEFGNNLKVQNLSNTDILAPGEVLSGEVLLIPDEREDYLTALRIFHSNNSKFFVEFDISGKGIGTDINLSLNPIVFIPEILTRELTIENLSNTLLEVFEITTEPSDNFNIIGNFPVNLNPGEQFTFAIEALNPGELEGELLINASPCVLQRNTPIFAYQANTILRIENVEVDPRDRTQIDISYQTSENADYNGILPMVGEIHLDPNLFMAEEVISQYGNANLLEQRIENNRRYIRFQVEGDYGTEGSLLSIKGIAGLGSKDTSNVIFSEAVNYFGEAVNVSLLNGIYTLINICEDRFLINPANSLKIEKINPTPASDKIEVQIFAPDEDLLKIEIYDIYGKKVYTRDKIRISEDMLSMPIEVSSMPTGTYVVHIKGTYSKHSKSFIISR